MLLGIPPIRGVAVHLYGFLLSVSVLRWKAAGGTRGSLERRLLRSSCWEVPYDPMTGKCFCNVQHEIPAPTKHSALSSVE